MSAATVGAFMTAHPHTVARDAKLVVAHDLMRAFHVRHLPVLEDGRLVGLVSLGDLHLIETLRDVAPDSVTVAEAMTERPYCATSDTPLAEVARAMEVGKLGCAVVVEGERVLGLFTCTDALRVLSRLLGEGRRRPGGRRPTPRHH